LNNVRFLEKQMKSRKKTLVLVTVLYLIITSAIGLCHSDDCLLSALNEGKTNVPSSSEHCLACIFSAGFNSTEANHGLLQLTIEGPVIYQPTRHSTIPDHHEWAYSILLRGPPLASTS